MKKLLLSTLVLSLVTSLIKGQTSIDLSGLTDDVRLGQNCSSSQTPQEFITTGDVNLNGYEIELRNSILIVTGNLNGPGEIEGCGQSEVCVQGVVQNNPEVEDVSECNTLSINNVIAEDLKINYNKITQTITIPNVDFIMIYDLTGKLITKSEKDKIYIQNIKNEILLLYTNKGTFKFLRKYYT